ncbi:hypothetical protein IF1G_04230 [Cordyceps javanica]|uniref:Uncharacterized protein n=1 Tax=Cordyceps javanica TaxID=43265 RepID=A0A545V5J9_9HYPO|nr:hypothetical protein IF1G_04230 [Cordyceps javanica]
MSLVRANKMPFIDGSRTFRDSTLTTLSPCLNPTASVLCSFITYACASPPDQPWWIMGISPRKFSVPWSPVRHRDSGRIPSKLCKETGPREASPCHRQAPVDIRSTEICSQGQLGFVFFSDPDQGRTFTIAPKSGTLMCLGTNRL